MKVTLLDGTIVEVTMSRDNTHIENSYKIKKRKTMKQIIRCAQISCKPDDAIACRSMRGMVREWCAHNLLYNLGIARKRTASVDLDMGEPWYRRVGYFILSVLYIGVQLSW